MGGEKGSGAPAGGARTQAGGEKGSGEAKAPEAPPAGRGRFNAASMMELLAAPAMGLHWRAQVRPSPLSSPYLSPSHARSWARLVAPSPSPI